MPKTEVGLHRGAIEFKQVTAISTTWLTILGLPQPFFQTGLQVALGSCSLCLCGTQPLSPLREEAGKAQACLVFLSG